MKLYKTLALCLFAICVIIALPQSAYASLINPEQTGSITIYSIAVEDTGDYQEPATGEETDVSGEPLQNVRYSVTKVDDEATEPATAQPVTGDDAYSNTTATDEYGRARFADLAQGIYLVHQEDSAAVQEPVADFLVSVPMTNPAGNQWIYDVHVYPKYQLTSPPELSAFVTEVNNRYDSVDLLGTATWIIEAQIPGDIKNAQNFEIQGILGDYLQYQDGSANVYAFDGTNRTSLTVNEDYSAAEEDDTLTVTLTEKGQQKLDTALADGSDVLHLQFDALLDIPEENLEKTLASPVEIDTQLRYTSSLGRPASAQLSGEKPYVYTGGFHVSKVSNTNSQPLSGAEFKIFRTLEDARTGRNAIQRPGGGGDWVGTTDQSGIVSFAGLAYGGKGIASNAGSTAYYLVQTQAPAGYNLLRAPEEIAVNATSFLEENAIEIRGRSGFLLPATGGMGTVWFTVGGLLLIGLAVYFFWRSRMRRKEERSAD